MTSEMDNFDLSICICTRNRPDELRKALNSIQLSTRRPYEVVVSDDGTNAHTRELISEHYPEVRYNEGPRRGLCANRNAAIAVTSGTHILFIDDDVTLTSDFIEQMTATYRLTPAAQRDRCIFTGSELNDGRRVCPNGQSFLGFQSRAYRPGEKYETVVINATVFPKALFERLLFNENIVYGYDEVDMTTRAVSHGFSIVPVLNAWNTHTPSTINRDEYRPYIDASRLYVTYRRYLFTERRVLKALVFAVLAPVHLLLHLLKSRSENPIGRWMRSLTTVVRYLREDSRRHHWSHGP